ncbi:multivesicular body subunit 12A isoform X2 [Columba livia]|uniref:multivesicular body subunit 12A isoform X2 n=1 Tax=Columba livia TaxID=8932 RepID=UPI0031B9BE9D
MAAAEGSALTGVAWSAAPDAAPAGWTITGTVEGTPANLGKGFGNKGGGFLCVSTGGAQASPGSVVTDVQVLSDRTPHPPGYTRVPEFPESRAAASRKKRVYVKLLPAGAAETAVTELKVTGKSRTLPGYLRIGEMGGFAIWCKKGPFSRPGAPPAPPPTGPRPPPAPPPAPAPPAPPQQVSNEHQTRISLRRLRHLRPLGDGRRPLRPAPQIRSQAQLRHQRSRRRSKRQIARRHRQRVQLHVRGGKDGGRSAPARRLLAPTPRG